MAEASDDDLVEFRMPSLGSDMESGTVIGWRVAEGDAVSKGDVLLDVDTDKSEIEVEVWHDARVAQILVDPGATVAVGTPIARLHVGAVPGRPGPSDGRRAASTLAAGTGGEAPTSSPAEVAEVTPATRSSGGRAGTLVTPRTVYWQAPPSPALGEDRSRPATTTDVPAPSEERRERRQSAVAQAMEQSNREIPHFHLSAEIDLEPTLAWLEAANDERRPPERILRAAVFLRAVARTVVEHRSFNGAWTGGRFVAADSVDVGVAIHLRDGTLITPVIADADRLGLDRLMAAFRGLVGRARSGGLTSSDIAEPTITVTNLGDTGADAVAGLIRPPQVALVGFGRVRQRPVVVDRTVVAHPTVLATVSADHRANNGQAAAAFLTTLAERVRSPEAL